MSQQKETDETANNKKVRKTLAQRFSKNRLTSMIVEKDFCRLGCVTKANVVPIIRVLEDQLNSNSH